MKRTASPLNTEPTCILARRAHGLQLIALCGEPATIRCGSISLVGQDVDCLLGTNTGSTVRDNGRRFRAASQLQNVRLPV